MAQTFPWKRFWCRRENSYSLGDRGFLTGPEGRHGKHLNPNLVSFDQLQTAPCLALLGEPGIGKSQSLAADVDAYLEQSPEMATMRLDLRSYGSEDRLYHALFEDPEFVRWKTGDHILHLYIDSLDECLLRIDNVAAMLADELPNHPLSRLKLRIACRTAAWHPLLEHALRKGYGDDGFVAAELVPLRRTDVREAAVASGISDPDGFLGRIDQLKIAPFAIKPVTLRMLLDTYVREGDLPNNALDLYEKGCSIMCEEQNESRRAASKVGSLSPKDRVAIASRIAAATQLGNRYAIWTGTEGVGVPEEDVTLSELVGGSEVGDSEISAAAPALRETLDTGLFSSRGAERLGWSHQTLAEYLAARYCIARKLTIQQLRSLIFHPRRKRVIPQVREVASWLVLQIPELFSEIAEYDPEVLLGSGSASLSPEQRVAATEALLKSSDIAGFLHFKRLNFHNLAHPGLADQLRPVLVDANRPLATRYLAVNIARECEVADLCDVFADLMLSEAEPMDLRKAAGYAVVDLGSDSQRARLAALLNTTRDDDPRDELRGVALQAVYHGQKYDDAMWDCIDAPRASLFFGAYHAFLSYSVLPKINVNNLPAALRWSERQPIQDIGPIPDLQGEIFSLAIEHIAAPGVADLLADAILTRARAHRGIPHGNSRKNVEEALQGDTVRRRRFLESLLPLLNKETAHVVMWPLSLLSIEDLPWYIERVTSGTSPVPAVDAAIIHRLGCSWEHGALQAIWDACQSNAFLNEQCGKLFDAWPLDSPEVEFYRTPKRDPHEDLEKASALLPRCEEVLRLVEGGDADAWLPLTLNMSVEEGETHYANYREIEVDKLPGWTLSSDEMKARIISAAKSYLMQSDFPSILDFPSNSVMNGAIAGVNALELLHSVEREYLQSQPAEFWNRWIPSLVIDRRAAEVEREEAITSTFKMAADISPDGMTAALMKQIQFESDAEQKYLFCYPLIDLAWSQGLASALFHKLQQDDLAPGIQADILYRLLTHNVAGAKTWAEEVVRNEYESNRGLRFARSLVDAGGDASWPVIWPLMEKHPQFGRKLMEDVSYGGHGRQFFTHLLDDAALGKLYEWLLAQYHMEDDRPASGAVGPVDTVRHLRDGALEQLKQRGTFEACDQIAHAELQFPQYESLRYHFDQAEVEACARTWVAPSPRAILEMGANGSKRFVESSEQLMDVVLESLARLQAELHGELPAVVDLWNLQNGDHRPKTEDEISDYVTRFLKRDLEERGIVINREVQIRLGQRGEMQGQFTDIHVDTVQAAGSSELYGVVKLIIEVKGTWNAGLMTDMEVQLRDRYMKNNDCRCGIYLALHPAAETWTDADNRKTKSASFDIDKLRGDLAGRASQLSGGAISIKSLVLDAALDSTSARL